MGDPMAEDCMQAEIDELRAALRPFAELSVQDYSGEELPDDAVAFDSPTAGEIRAAQRALKASEP